MKYMYPTPIILKKGDDATVYIYQQVKEDDITLFGLRKRRKRIISSLFFVKRIGCKTAIVFLRQVRLMQLLMR